MKKRLLLLVFIGISFVSAGWAQTENPALKTLEGVWILDSVYVAELKESTETPVDYNDIMNLDRVMFTKLDLRPGKRCILDGKRIEIPYGFYDIMDDGQLLVECEDAGFRYHYQLNEDLTLAGTFPGGAPDGLLAQYRVFMRFKKQLNR